MKSANTVPLSQIISQEEYKNLHSSTGFALAPTAERGEEADKRNVYRKNLFVSKPFVDLNKDFKFQPLIRNAQLAIVIWAILNFF